MGDDFLGMQCSMGDGGRFLFLKVAAAGFGPGFVVIDDDDDDDPEPDFRIIEDPPPPPIFEADYARAPPH